MKNKYPFALALLLGACSSSANLGPRDVSRSKTFHAPRLAVWKASVDALYEYTLVAANRTVGFLQTEKEPFYIGGASGPDPAVRTIASAYKENSYISELKLRLKTAEPSSNAEAYTVQIEKNLQYYNPVKGAYENIRSDGAEEEIIFAAIAKYLKDPKKESLENATVK